MNTFQTNYSCIVPLTTFVELSDIHAELARRIGKAKEVSVASLCHFKRVDSIEEFEGHFKLCGLACDISLKELTLLIYVFVYCPCVIFYHFFQWLLFFCTEYCNLVFIKLLQSLATQLLYPL